MQRCGLSIYIDVEGARHTLALAGELDMATARALKRAGLQACREGAQELVLDLRELTFMDSTGLHTILALREHCGALYLKHEHANVRRVFELTGIADLLGPTPSAV